MYQSYFGYWWIKYRGASTNAFFYERFSVVKRKLSWYDNSIENERLAYGERAVQREE